MKDAWYFFYRLQFDGLCTQFEEKQLSSYVLQTLRQTSKRNAWFFIGYDVQIGLYTISEKTAIRLPSLQEQAITFIQIVILLQRKI